MSIAETLKNQLIAISTSVGVVLLLIVLICTLLAFLVLLIIDLYRRLFGRLTSLRRREEQEIEIEKVVVIMDGEKVQKVAENCTECAICLEDLDANFEEEEAEDNNNSKNDNNNNYDNNNNNDDDDDDDHRCLKWVLRQCGHKFHAGCLARWFNVGGKTCPICRVDVPIIRFPLMPRDAIRVEV